MVMQIKLAVVERLPASDHLAYLKTHLLAIKTCIFELFLCILGVFRFDFVVAILFQTTEEKRSLNRPTTHGVNMGYLKEVFLAASY